MSNMQKETRKKVEIGPIVKKYLGCAKPRPRLTKEQLEQIAIEHTPERAKEITKMLGLKDDEVAK